MKQKSDSRSNEELNFKKHVAHDKQMEKEKEKEELPNQLVDKVAENRKPDQDPADKPLSKKAKRDKFPLESGRDNEPAQKSATKGEDNKKSSEQIVAKNAPSDNEGVENLLKGPNTRRNIFKSLTELENKAKGEKAKQPKKHKLVNDDQSRDDAAIIECCSTERPRIYRGTFEQLGFKRK